MDVLEAIFTRRSIRRYSDKEIDTKIVDKIIHAGMYAPSAVNKQPWHFIVFEKEETCRAIMEVHRSSSMLSEANKSILVCVDENLQHDEGYGLLDCSAATENMLLAAHALGLGACWIGIFPRKNRMDGVKTIFNLPDHVLPLAIVSLGYPAETKDTPDRIKPDRIHYEHW
ncbi:MAG: nitroreductase family protein [Bacteroidales bacterium]|jgi:nitroreductase